MFGLGKAAAKVSDVAFGTDFSEDERDFSAEVQEQLAPEPTPPVTVTAKQIGIVKPFVKDPQQDYNHLVELFGVLGESEKYIVCSCPECGHVEKGLYNHFSSTVMDTDITCSVCGYEDEFAEFYDLTLSEFQTSRQPSLREVCMTVSSDRLDNFDEDDENCQDYFENVRSTLLKYYAILSGKDKPDHAGEQFGPIFLNESGNYVMKHAHGWDNRVDDLMYFGKIKSLQAVNQESSEDE